MHVSVLAYVVVGLVVAGLLVLDLTVLRRSGGGALRAAAIATVAWTVVGLAVTGPVILIDGGSAGTHYVTIYLLERALSLDNVAVFAIVLASLRVDVGRRERLVVMGVAIALVLRVLLIGGGLALVDALHAALYVFGALLLVTGLRTIRSGLPSHDEEGGDEGEGGWIVRLAHRMPRGAAAFLPVVALALADVVFAVDSIPAAFGVTRDAFPIVVANAFSVLGLHAAYVLLEGGLARFRYLDTGLGVVLLLIGVELVAGAVVHVPSWLTLLAVAAALAIAIGASLRHPEERLMESAGNP